MGWYAAVRVDGKSFQVLGNANLVNTSQASQRSFSFTPTQSSYLFDCEGRVTVNMTFVTPFQVWICFLSQSHKLIRVISSRPRTSVGFLSRSPTSRSSSRRRTITLTMSKYTQMRQAVRPLFSPLRLTLTLIRSLLRFRLDLGRRQRHL